MAFKTRMKSFWNRIRRKANSEQDRNDHDRDDHDGFNSSTPASPDVSAVSDSQLPDDRSLWERAYEKIGPELVKNYEELLEEKWNEAVSSRRGSKKYSPRRFKAGIVEDHQAKLETIMETDLQRMKEESVFRDNMTQVADLVKMVQGFLDAAVKASPQVSVLWTGVCFILPILTKRRGHDHAYMNGFAYVTSRMHYYLALEKLLWPENLGQTRIGCQNLKRELELHVVELYQHILQFQLDIVLRLHRSEWENMVRGIVGIDDWRAMVFEIQRLESIVNDDSSKVNTLAARRVVEKSSQHASQRLESLKNLLTSSDLQFQVAENYRVLYTEQYQRQEEQRCHEIFRLTKTDDGNSYERYKNRIEGRVEGTCEWFIAQPNFKNWKKQQAGPLLISADPGCGKSVLAKYLIDHILPAPDVTVCYFFFKDQDKNTLTQAICALLHQLFSYKPFLIQHAMEEFYKDGANLVNLSTTLCDILENAARDLHAGSCYQATGQTTSKTKNLSHDISDNLEERLLAITHRTYLWVYLVFDYLEEHIFEKSKKSIVLSLRDLPVSVNQAYEKVLSRSSHKDKIRKALCIILAATRPLTLTEMNCAMNIEISSQSKDDLGLESDEDFERTLRSWCDLFVSIFDGSVYFLHQTAREFLLQDNTTHSNHSIGTWNRSIKECEAQYVLAVSCVTYIDMISQPDDDPCDFMEYSASSWFIHARQTNENDYQRLHQAVLRLCDVNAERPPLWFKPEISDFVLHFTGPKRFNSMCIASYHGLEQVVRLLLKLGFSYTDSGYGPLPLRCAARQGYETITRLLLASTKVSPDIQGIFGFPPLNYAVMANNKRIFRLLLSSNKVDPNMRDERDYTPFRHAVRGRNTDMIRLLLSSARFDPNLQDKEGNTSFQDAVIEGDEDVVRLLLSSDKVDPNVRDKSGFVPLYRALVGRNRAVIRLLLSSDKVNLDFKDRDGKIRFDHVLIAQDEIIIGSLLSSVKINPDKQDMDSNTATAIALEQGREDVAILLLCSQSFNPANRHQYLPEATRRGFRDIVEVLLEKHKVDVNLRDCEERTALSYAAQNGNVEIIRLLLNSKMVDINCQDRDDLTPLDHAIGGDHKAIIELLKERGATKLVS